MNEEPAPEPTDVEVDALDNFDLSTPAEVEARQAASQEEPGDEAVVETEVEPVKPETNPDSETPEPKPYVAPQKVQMQVPKFEAEIPVDEYGNIDPKGLADYMQKFSEHAVAAAEAKANNAYYENVYGQREWSDVGEAYPELVKNESTRSLIENLRVADAVRGGKGELMEAAKTFSDQLTTARNEGIASTQSNITRQKSVSPTASSRTIAPSANTNSSLRKKAMGGGYGADEARIQYLSNLIDSNSI